MLACGVQLRALLPLALRALGGAVDGAVRQAVADGAVGGGVGERRRGGGNGGSAGNGAGGAWLECTAVYGVECSGARSPLAPRALGGAVDGAGRQAVAHGAAAVSILLYLIVTKSEAKACR